MENLIQQTDHLSQNVFLAPDHICLTVAFLPSSQPYTWRILQAKPQPKLGHALLSIITPSTTTRQGQPLEEHPQGINSGSRLTRLCATSPS